MGMTMKRSEKATAQAMLKPEADGYTKQRFASPKLIAKARADRGHDRMTPAEYAAHRMGRGVKSATGVEDTRRQLAETRRGQRELGGRRITGRQQGSKKPQAWSRGDVERKVAKKWWQ